MKMKRWTKPFIFGAAALLAGAAALPEAMAYFTTYVSAAGGYRVTLGSYTEIQEDVSDMTKHIVIQNTGETECYVRVKVFGGSLYELSYEAGESWTQGEDGYWYYQQIVPAGGQTSQLNASITVPENSTETFQIVVIQECTPVLYRENGEPYGDWERQADTTIDIGTAWAEGSVNP